MITPKTDINPEMFKSFSFVSMPSKTFYIDFDKGCITGIADGIEAVKQAIYFILRTERYRYIIFSKNYGIELDDLYGKRKQYIIPQLGRRILEAIMQDDRITSVSDFSFLYERNSYSVNFCVGTIYGNNIDFFDKVVI